jgi:hypothetical protein
MTHKMKLVLLICALCLFPIAARAQATATDLGYTMDKFVAAFNGLHLGARTPHHLGLVDQPGDDVQAITGVHVRTLGICWTPPEYHDCGYRSADEPADAALTLYLESKNPSDKINLAHLSATFKKGSPSAVKWVLTGCTAVVALLNPGEAELIINLMARVVDQNEDGVPEIRQIGGIKYEMKANLTNVMADGVKVDALMFDFWAKAV